MNNYQIKRIYEALDNLEHLSEWENDFINNLAEKPEGYQLSEKENHIINRISQKIGEI